ERPWLPLFARGAKLPEPAQFPSPQEIVQGWQEVSSKLTTALESASDEVLSAPTPEKSPSFDGKVSGMVSFLAFHEAYHVGQAAYLRCWLGRAGIVG
ncbi:MAG: DinB family protein, partial [Terracidiphilus sp.]